MLQLQYLQEVVLVNIGHGGQNFLEYFVSGVTAVNEPRSEIKEDSFHLLYPGAFWDRHDLLPEVFFSDCYRWLRDITCMLTCVSGPLLPTQYMESNEVSGRLTEDVEDDDPEEIARRMSVERVFSCLNFHVADSTRPAFFAARFRNQIGIRGINTWQRVVTIQEPRLRLATISSLIGLVPRARQSDLLRDLDKRSAVSPQLGRRIDRYVLVVVPDPLIPCVVQPLPVPPNFLPHIGRAIDSIPWPDLQWGNEMPEALTYVYEASHRPPGRFDLWAPPPWPEVVLTFNASEKVIAESSALRAVTSFRQFEQWRLDSLANAQ